jgi:hypothetical protein
MTCTQAFVLCLTLAATTVTSGAIAQQDEAATRSAGRRLAQDGVALLQQGKADAASEKLEKAYQVLQVPSVGLWSGRALAARGLLVEAAERYVEASRLTGFKGDQQVQLQAQKEATRELESVTPRIPTLIIVVAHQGSEPLVVTLDGKPVPTALLGEEQPVNPGNHEISLTVGSKRAIRQVTVKENEKKRESIAFDDPSAAAAAVVATPPLASGRDEGAAPAGAHRTLAYVALAGGGAGLIVGGVAGALALGKHSTLEGSGNCYGDKCRPIASSEVDSLNTLRAVSTIGFIAGGVLASAGVVLLLTAKPAGHAAHTTPDVALSVSPRALLLSGAF